MQNSHPKGLRPVSVPRPEKVVEEYYDRLREWAMGLTRGDVDVAFDIVHDLYLYIRLAKPDFSRVENFENYLYKCLRNIHLARLSESSRNAWQNVSAIELDSLEFAFWANSESFVLERQNELRQICHYAVHRKAQTKSASLFIFRFFHDYSVQAISEIANIPLTVVQPSLSKARTELQRYLDSPDDSQFAGMKNGDLQWAPISSQEFHQELRATIMHARDGDCLTEEELISHYQSPVPKAIPCSLLSHLVSCERCLALVDKHFRRPTLGDRGPFRQLAGKQGKQRRFAGRNLHALSFKEMSQIVSRHYEDVFQHRPRVLSIAVDGKVVASHHVEACRSVQSVRIERPDQAGGIEVFSEFDVRLMLILLEDLPPHGPSVRMEHIELSDGRWIEMRLTFDSLGVNSEVTYFDPLLQTDSNALAVEDEDDAPPAVLQIVPTKPETEGVLSRPNAPDTDTSRFSPGVSVDWRSQFWSRVKQMCFPEPNPLLVGGLLCSLAAIAFFSVWMYRLPRVTPAALLTSAEQWDTGMQHNAQPGVVYQKVRITTQKHSVERAIYRDAQGFRRPRHNKLSSEDEALRQQLAQAGVSWDEPLSAASYKDWRDRISIQRDQVTRDGQSLLKLTTTASNRNSLVLQETLTVRESDFHPVDRTVELRDYGTVEIAELNYDVLPWSIANPDWFEQPADANGLRLPRSSGLPALRLPSGLSESDLDEAELEASLALTRLHLDAGRQMNLIRGKDGLHVVGIVDTAIEKRALQSELSLIPHVVPAISTVEELNIRQRANGISSVQTRSVVSSGASSAERYIAEKGMDRSTSVPLTLGVVDSAFVVNHESKTIGDLWRRFGSNQDLSPNARMALSELVVQHKAALLAAIEEEQQRLIDLKLISAPVLASDSVQGNSAELEAAAQRNFSLCVELTSPGAEEPRLAEEIAPQLGQTLTRLRNIILHISAASMISPPTLNKATVENQSK